MECSCTSFCRSKNKKKRLLHEYKLSSSDYHFLFVGHNYKRKGLDILLEALSLLPRKDFHLSVVGKDKNLAFYEQKVRTLKLEKKVSFFGSIPSVLPFYQFADALVVPSYYDPFANVTVEALAMGLFVITSPYNGGKEVLKETSGLILPDLEKKDAFVEALLSAMKHPKTELQASSIRKTVEHLNVHSCVDRLIQACF